jgi:ABC-type polysaccharide/polyol phosphate transport system ATPase subunit
MTDVAIRVEGLGKQYRIGQRERYQTLRDTLTDTACAPFRWMRSLVSPSSPGNAVTPGELFWALKDVSFEVPRGAVVGIIGRNGAGKSTLLKILSRVTEPTEGRVEIRGRVGSLLEVGTGFHPELTGRENIFLNGAILGMPRSEIVLKFDEIVAFAEIEKFVDTPVKRYSSGLYVRLAFAVAAHLESDILLVDEVLAVGDTQFRQKCLGKMGDVARAGRTVVLVTHQMNQVRRLSHSCMWLHQGRLKRFGAPIKVLGDYEAAALSSRLESRPTNGFGASASFLSWQIDDECTEVEEHYQLRSMGPFAVKFVLQVNRTLQRAVHGVAVLSPGGQNLWGTAYYNLRFEPGVYELVHSLPGLLLQPGAYVWQVSISEDQSLIDLWDCRPEFIVATRPMTHPRDEYAGILNIPSRFHVSKYAASHRPAEVVHS